MPRVTQAMKSRMRLEEIQEAGAVMVPGGRTWFYIYPINTDPLFFDNKEKFGIFFPSTGMDLRFTKSQAEVMVEFFKQNKLAE